MKYRIKRTRQGTYIAQYKGNFCWCDMFAGGTSDLPDEFPSLAAAEDKILEEHERLTRIGQLPTGVVKEFEL